MGMKWETDAVEPNYLEESSILVVLRAKTQYSATLKRMGALSGTRKKKKKNTQTPPFRSRSLARNKYTIPSDG